MHKYLDKLENNINNKKIKNILFNKYYNLKDLYWTLVYSVSLSALAGLGNTFIEPKSNLSLTLFLFLQGFINNFYLSLIISTFYARLINGLVKLKNLRINGNIAWAVTQIMFFIWHSILGTKNPLNAIILPAVAALILTNFHINTILKQKNSKI